MAGCGRGWTGCYRAENIEISGEVEEIFLGTIYVGMKAVRADRMGDQVVIWFLRMKSCGELGRQRLRLNGAVCVVNGNG